MKLLQPWLIALAIAALAGAAVFVWDRPAFDLAERSGNTIVGVPRVVDGDTLVLAGERIRLRSIDAPEVDTEAGKAGTRVMLSLVGSHRVTCSGDRRDRYGRLLADCTAGGRDLAEAMIRAGAARRWR